MLTRCKNGDGERLGPIRGQVRGAWTAVGTPPRYPRRRGRTTESRLSAVRNFGFHATKWRFCWILGQKVRRQNGDFFKNWGTMVTNFSKVPILSPTVPSVPMPLFSTQDIRGNCKLRGPCGSTSWIPFLEWPSSRAEYSLALYSSAPIG